MRVFGIVVLAITLSAPGSRGETIAVPLNHSNGWQFLRYRHIPANTFRPTPDGLEIGVTNSAAPAVFSFTNALRVIELRVSGRISGSLKLPSSKQGQKGFDDYALRVGLVEAGTRTLTWREKISSPGWIKQLFAVAPAGTGVSKIHFFNVGTDAKQICHTRVHPMGDLIQETIVAVPDSAGHFAFTNRFAPPMNVFAVWLSADGDDTHSSFAVTIEQAELRTVNK